MSSEMNTETYLQIQKIDPSVFDRAGTILSFVVNKSSIGIHTLREGFIEIECKSAQGVGSYGPVKLAEAAEMLVLRPDICAILVALNARYQSFCSRRSEPGMRNVTPGAKISGALVTPGP